jgi:hypothetical protein
MLRLAGDQAAASERMDGKDRSSVVVVARGGSVRGPRRRVRAAVLLPA